MFLRPPRTFCSRPPSWTGSAARCAQRYSPEEIAKLRIRASAWLAGNGYIDEAIEHSVTAGDVAEAVRLVETHRHAAMNQERWPDLQRWLSLLPRQAIDAQLGLVLAEAWLLHHRAARADLPERLARAEALLRLQKEIARALSISPMTVKRHSSNIYQKLAVEGRREAVAKALALGLVSAAPYPRLPDAA